MLQQFSGYTIAAYKCTVCFEDFRSFSQIYHLPEDNLKLKLLF